MNKEAVQHERGPRNSTIRRQVALYLKESVAAAAAVSMANSSILPSAPALTSRITSSLTHLPRPQPILPPQSISGVSSNPWASIFANSGALTSSSVSDSSTPSPLHPSLGFYHPSLASFNPLLFFSLPELSRSLLRSSYPYHLHPYRMGYDVASLTSGLSSLASERSSSVVLDKRDSGS